MRTIIYNANIITGDGKTIIENCSLFLKEEFIDGIGRVPYPIYENAERMIDARGNFIIPGIINAHTHGSTTGPQPVGNASPGLPKLRVRQNLNQHILEGTTTVCNQDGLNTMDEVAEARSVTPMLVQTATIHTPPHIKDAEFINNGGLKEKHKLTTVEEMIRQGALGIGEIGGWGIGRNESGGKPDVSYYDLIYLPLAMRVETGVRVTPAEIRPIREALSTQPPDEKTALALMTKLGMSKGMAKMKYMMENSDRHVELVLEGYEKAAEAAGKLKVPMFMHNSPQTKPHVLDFVKELKGLLYALHSNFLFKPHEAIEVARFVKKAGGWVEVCSFDFFRARRLCPSHVTTLALLAEGLVDTIGTDYCSGYWGSIPQVLKYAVDQNAIELPQAIALGTGNVVKAIPNVAPNRGEIAEGKIADLAILSQRDISEVRTVLIGGKVVVDEGRIVSSPE